MKKHLITGLPAALLAGALCTPLTVDACAPYFEPSYINNSENLYVPVYREKAAIQRLIKNCGDLIPLASPLDDGINSKIAEQQSFEEALKRYTPNMPEDQRRVLREHHKWYAENYFYLNQIEFPDEFIEFKLYLKGYKQMHELNGKGVPEAWKKLLALPKEKRHFRTVWVYYLLGNSLKDPQYYRLCRQAVRDGFSDPAGLGYASYKNEVRYSNIPLLEKIKVALEAQKNDPSQTLLSEYCRKFAQKCSDAEYHQIMQDPLGREVLALTDGESVRFLKYSSHLTFRNGDIIAFKFFKQGDHIAAIDWIKRMEKPTLLSLYIEAKIARMNGNLPLAGKKLRAWLEMAKQIDPNDRSDIDLIRRYDNCESTDNIENDVYGLLGLTLVMRRDFMEAAEFFYRAGQYESDLCLIAEHFFTLEQLMEFADKIAADANKEYPEGYPQSYIAGRILHLTARRAFREGRMDIARKYMPQMYIKHLDDYEKFMALANDRQRSGNERAIALYNAAKIMRYKGMELCGTEGEPDNSRYRGNHSMVPWIGECPNCEFDLLGRWDFCEYHRATYYRYRTGLNGAPDYMTVPLYQRWHYRFTAAGMAIQAGALAEDDDLRALIYLFGGECLRLQSPKEADILYKKLVLECRKSPLSKLADTNRWFPVDNIPLRKQIKNLEPLKDLDEVKKIMLEAFPPEQAAADAGKSAPGKPQTEQKP